MALAHILSVISLPNLTIGSSPYVDAERRSRHSLEGHSLNTAVLYSAPSRKSTLERSQPNLGQTMWSNSKYWAPSWRLHPLGAEIRKIPSIPGLLTPHHGADTCCIIQNRDGSDFGTCCSTL